MGRTPATVVEDQRPRSSRLVGALAACVILSACATRAPVPDDRPERLARAGALVAEGCYDCLLDARRLYASLSANEPDGAAVALRVFELDLLLALREKELALDASPALDRARAATPRLPDAVEGARLVQAVERARADADGTPFAEQPLAERVSPADGDQDRLTWIRQQPDLSPLAREYLELSLACTAPRADRRRLEEIPTSRTPLLRYRRAICTQPFDREALEQVRTEVPRFAEAAVFEARAAFADLARTDGSEMLALLAIAYARFARSPLVLLYLGLRSQTIGDCREAVAHFAQALLVRERHERARLGRAICRTFLGEPQGAIGDATLLIDAGAYNQADAYYWRAYNRHRLKELELARQDIERAKRQGSAPSRVYTLAGIIAHDQDELEAAEADLARAVSDPAECLARWYYGVVGYKTRRWAESAARFGAAEACYRQSADRSRREREVMLRRTDLEPAFRERQIAGFDAAIREDTALAAGAALDAATAFAVSGDRAAALAALARAADDPREDRKETVRRLLDDATEPEP
jgi:hypothetical protein